MAIQGAAGASGLQNLAGALTQSKQAVNDSVTNRVPAISVSNNSFKTGEPTVTDTFSGGENTRTLQKLDAITVGAIEGLSRPLIKPTLNSTGMGSFEFIGSLMIGATITFYSLFGGYRDNPLDEHYPQSQQTYHHQQY